MRQVFWKPKALRQLRKVQVEATKGVIYDAVETLTRFPDCPNVRKLKSREEFRLRVKGWRVIFRVSPNAITIEEIKRRDEQTY
ncbi:MAG: type II toxin-antitoxin system RelE/ParE family toxin [Candidatus Aminicenantes bacterium]|nr:type II toxin-antitoxin system RelE/ParE family toxin [Candidatus Aminicenantes bacterium]